MAAPGLDAKGTSPLALLTFAPSSSLLLILVSLFHYLHPSDPYIQPRNFLTDARIGLLLQICKKNNNQLEELAKKCSVPKQQLRCICISLVRCAAKFRNVETQGAACPNVPRVTTLLRSRLQQVTGVHGWLLYWKPVHSSGPFSLLV